MKLPKRMRIRVLADAHPLAGMFVSVDLKASWRNDFNLSFGPTNELGELVVTLEELQNRARELRDFFVMDYGDLCQDFAGTIVVSPRNRDSLERAIQAYDSYQQVVPFPPRYAEEIQEARLILGQLQPRVLSVEVEHDGKGVVVRAEATPA